MTPPDGQGKLPAEVKRLGWISFSIDVASEMLYPLIPIFVSQTLGAPGRALGWIEGAADAIAAITSGGAGLTSDRWRKRVPFIRIGYGLAAVGKPLLALATSWPAVLALRAIDRFGKGLRGAPRDALIADLVEPAQRGRAFGFHRAMDTAGAFTGVLATLALLHWVVDDYRTIFWLTAIPGAAAIALTWRLREPERGAPSLAERPRVSPRDLPRRYWFAAASLWLFGLANSSDVFLLLRASEQGFDPRAVVIAYALYNLVYAVTSTPAGAWSDRVGRPAVLRIALLVHAAVYAGFAQLGGAHLWWLFALYGLHMGLMHAVSTAWIADAAPPHAKATALGVFRLGLGFAALTASVAAGWMWDEISRSAPFWLGAIGALAGLAATSLAASRDRSR